jgi:UDP-glucose 6-dehydrogenase
MKNICVIGTGYVGLVTGTCFADLGNTVVCVDINSEKIALLQAGQMPIYEPGLEEMVERNVRAGRLIFTTSYSEGLSGAEFVFIAVGTPSGVDGEADLRYVRMAAEEIAATMVAPLIIINKSTVPVGTGDWVADIISHTQPRPIDFAVVSNPEFLREGNAIADFLNPDRVVLGSLNKEAAEKVAQLHLALRAPIVVTDLRTAEMIKYASNAFLATRISFINEIAAICEELGADVKEVAAGMGYDKRIGKYFLDAGLGYGGSCFSADTTVFVLNGHHVAAKPFANLVPADVPPSQGGIEVFDPGSVKKVLAFDLGLRRGTLADVHCVTRRWYEGPMIVLKTSVEHQLRVTADHPVVHYDATSDSMRTSLATEIGPNDKLVFVPGLPETGIHMGGGEDWPTTSQAASAGSDYDLLEVSEIRMEHAAEYVYSMETATGTLLTASGLVAHNCFPKDVLALEHMALVHGTHPSLLRAVMDINRDQRRKVIHRLRQELGRLQDKTIGLLGLAFKPNTDDMREAAAVEIGYLLQNEGAHVKGYDPVSMRVAARELPGMQLAEDAYDLAEGCDAVVVCTEWNEFRHLDMDRIRRAMRTPVVYDGRNIYDPEHMARLGFRYHAVGRGHRRDGSKDVTVTPVLPSGR